MNDLLPARQPVSRRLRVRGIVQGVGFRPAVWRIANALQLSGDVLNDGGGVLINLFGLPDKLDCFIRRLRMESPPLARIDEIVEITVSEAVKEGGFHIVESYQTSIHTAIVADAATCQACLEDIRTLANRRYRYPFTNCTHCGPRFSIVRAIPFDRANTSMNHFSLCGDCAGEYTDTASRRFHAQPNACPACGPKVWLTDSKGNQIDCEDPIIRTVQLLLAGKIVAIKGVGGIHLACDARNTSAVASLRRRKHRPHKPLAMMARNVEQVRNYCHINATELAALGTPAAPIVLLAAIDTARLPQDIAPGQKHWGFMLPYSPLHHLLMDEIDGPIVLSSGNLSEEPQCVDNQDALLRLDKITDYFLLHDRPIVNRIDDSVVRSCSGQLQVLRRARGYAPTQFALPAGFEKSDGILALGGELKNTFCLLKDGQAVLSQHIGDLEDARTYDDFQHNLKLFGSLYEFSPSRLVIDAHPEYLSAKHGSEWAHANSLQLSVIQHHHAHIASCMADNNIAMDHPPVMGIVLDGLGMGDDNTLWGGEVMLADYVSYRRLARLKPVALIGGAQAMREPWRNTYAHLASANLWAPLRQAQSELPLVHQLQKQALKTVDKMLSSGLNCPLSSSAGRLFDAVAGATDIAPTTCSYEAQAAMALEAMVDKHQMEHVSPYTFDIKNNGELFELDPATMWESMLNDIIAGTDNSFIATRFHKGLAQALVELASQLCHKHKTINVALSGGVFQNQILLELIQSGLQKHGLIVLTHRQFPANDGGISLGQALVAAARQLKRS